MESMQANPAQIKKYLKQLSNSREQYVNYLGQLAYQEYREGSLPNPKLQEACVTLDEIAGQMTKWEQDLAVIEQMRQAAKSPHCARCGAPVAKGAPFCSSCGQPMAPVSAAPMPAAAPMPVAGKACASCGGSLSPDATFCTFCGKPVTADVPAAPMQATAPAPPAPMPAAAPAPPEVAAPTPGPAPAEATPAAEPPAPQAAAGPLTCSSCGKSYDDPETMFCTECGNKMR